MEAGPKSDPKRARSHFRVIFYFFRLLLHLDIFDVILNLERGEKGNEQDKV
jgi:hypothetical protein